MTTSNVKRRGTVLIVVENVPARGDRRVWPECLALKEAGYEVIAIGPQWEGHAPSVEHDEGIEIHSFRQRPAGDSLVGYVKEYGSAFWNISRLARRLSRRHRFDIVHGCNPPDFLLLAVLPLKRRGARFIFDHHDLVPELFLSRFERRRLLYRAVLLLERMTFRSADVVLCTNESYKRVALTRGGKRPEDCFVVRNGPDLSRFRPNPDPALKRGQRHLISYVGEIGHQDGVDHAIRALGLLARRRRDWHAIFAGHGPAVPHARRLADDLGISGAVEFPGFVSHDEVMRIVSTSDVCLAPEPKNPFNDASTMIKIAEYMALSRPVVGYELVESKVTAGEAAVYAMPNDVESFARCIEDLLDDPERRARLGAMGRARVEELFSWARSKESLLAAYEHALAKPKR
jgi:glycosyltransferase involved in cell wall biosynthesis